MPTVPRCPSAQQERDRLQARRLRAAELFALGVRQAEVARQLGVSPQAVSVWHARWQHGGTDALRSRGPTGPAPKLSDRQLEEVEQVLLQGAGANVKLFRLAGGKADEIPVGSVAELLRLSQPMKAAAHS